jgi:predicted RNA polymerase sigma factor
MVSLSRAIAAAMADGPASGLAFLRGALEERLAGHYRLHAVRAHLLEMDGRVQDAIEDYEAAAQRTASVPEQQYLMTQAARLRHGISSGACRSSWPPSVPHSSRS